MVLLAFSPGKQQPGARKISEYSTQWLNVDASDNLKLLIHGNILEGSDVVDLLKWATAKHAPKGSKSERLDDFFALCVM